MPTTKEVDESRSPSKVFFTYDVDAVEVVRCKDCIHYWKNKPSDVVPVRLASPKDDVFCSEGERREDG